MSVFVFEYNKKKYLKKNYKNSNKMNSVNLKNKRPWSAWVELLRKRERH